MKYLALILIAFVIAPSFYLRMFQPAMVANSGSLVQFASWVGLSIPAVCLMLWLSAKVLYSKSA